MNMPGLRSLTGFVKVMIYLAFGFSLLAFLYVIGNFIYAMANADDLSHVTMTNIYEFPELAREHAHLPWQTPDGSIAFRMHKLYVELSYLNMPRTMVAAIYLGLLVLLTLFFIGVVQIANMFEDVGCGKPFVIENARRLRIIGFAMAGGAVFQLLWKLGLLVAFHREIDIAGAKVPYMLFAHQMFSPGLFFGGLVVLVISEVFRLGNRLEEEQKLTI
jgi:hypothetical protein